MKSMRYVVIGIGKYGSRIALEMAGRGAEVFAIDCVEERVEQVADDVAIAITMNPPTPRPCAVRSWRAWTPPWWPWRELRSDRTDHTEPHGPRHSRVIVRASGRDQERILRKLGGGDPRPGNRVRRHRRRAAHESEPSGLPRASRQGRNRRNQGPDRMRGRLGRSTSPTATSCASSPSAAPTASRGRTRSTSSAFPAPTLRCRKRTRSSCSAHWATSTGCSRSTNEVTVPTFSRNCRHPVLGSGLRPPIAVHPGRRQLAVGQATVPMRVQLLAPEDLHPPAVEHGRLEGADGLVNPPTSR